MNYTESEAKQQINNEKTRYFSHCYQDEIASRYKRGYLTAKSAVFESIVSCDWYDKSGIRKGWSNPSEQSIADYLGMSTRQVRRVIAELEADGIVIKETKNTPTGTRNKYLINYAYQFERKTIVESMADRRLMAESQSQDDMSVSTEAPALTVEAPGRQDEVVETYVVEPVSEPRRVSSRTIKVNAEGKRVVGI